ncbi:MAG: maltose alpha-D-glucosyltransferase [Bryobacteraceae bacterium]
MARAPQFQPSEDPLWYKDAIIYELHVRAFFDSGIDGIGDFRGLTEKLGYLQDLGVTALWVLPFSPSPWRDDGYDVSDYTDVHEAYGTLRDFHVFLREAHRRGLRVITEVVVNHTSDQHPWFQRARRAPEGSKWRDFYVWSNTPEKYKDARIIFKDFETSNWTWDPVAKAYYWHRFYSHQPDLNFESPHVRQAVLDVVDFWMDMGVDAFRLDAIPYLFEQEDTNCENLPQTHAFLKELRAHVDSKYKGRMLLAEANQWPEDAIAYFGNGDECNMAFHFPVMPRLFMATRMEDRYPIIDILRQTPPIPENCQWALFLRNHDELTLEMVTDEERDYMYRVYAEDRQMRINLGIRRRLAPLLGNDRRKIELLNALLFSLPGTPVIYYGDEIGMGDNIYLGDRNGVRTPMQWTADRNAGFSQASPQRLYLPITSEAEYHYETINVEAQQDNPNSLLWWMKRIIQVRKQSRTFGRGSLEFLSPDNRKMLVFYRRFEDQTVLVVANLSRFPQYAELDLSAVKGMTPVEMFGGIEFPVVGDHHYLLTLGAYAFMWFSLEKRHTGKESIAVAGAPSQRPLEVASWEQPLDERALSMMTLRLPEFLKTRRWFKSKERFIRTVRIEDLIQIPDADSYIIVSVVEYTEGDQEWYLLAASYATGEAAARIRTQFSDTIFAEAKSRDGVEGVIYTAFWNRQFGDALLGAIVRRRKFRGRAGELFASHNRALREVWGPKHPKLDPTPLRAEQSNSSIVFGDRFIMKVFRKIEPGINPELELGTFLTEKKFAHTPPVTGHIEYRPSDEAEPMQVAVLHGYVPNEGDAWRYTLDSLSRFFEAALARPDQKPTAHLGRHPLELASEELPAAVRELLGEYATSARLLGDRTAQLHLALADPAAPPEIAPEPITDHYRQGLYHGMISQVARSLELLEEELPTLSPAAAEDARAVLARANEIRNRMSPLRTRRIHSTRTRTHGDFHLGQVLFTGRDFVIIDFEGEVGRPLSERRLKRSPIRDVACMLRSFQYAAYAALYGGVAGISARPEGSESLEKWAAYWTAWVSGLYLNGYLNAAGKASFIPDSPEALRTLLDAHLFEKAMHEVSYELIHRPDWVRIPLRGTLALLT